MGADASVNYAKQEVGAFSRGMNNIIGTGKGIDMKTGEGVGDTFEAVGEQVVAAGGRMLTSAINGMTGGVKNIREGRATNPMIEQTFEGVDFRSFSFDYEFYPRSAEEARQVQEIIYTFKTAMLPDTYGAGLSDGDDEDPVANIENYFNYPNIFDVSFDGPLMEKLDGFLPMVCTGVSVDYFNGNSVAYFEDGTPITTSMKLDFSEIKILSQESYQEISPYGNKSITSMPSLTDTGSTETALDIDNGG